MKNALVKFLVEIIKTVVEGKNNKLRDPSARHIPRSLGASTVTVRQTTFLGVARRGRVTGCRPGLGLTFQFLRIAAEIYQDFLTSLRLHWNLLRSFKHILILSLVVIVLELVVDDVIPLRVVESVAVNMVLGVVQVGGLPWVRLKKVSLKFTGV